eukprot:Amastigsp_a343635_16.p4 type:complete len:131 gc:universal Amastigsp_a343635_16:1077-685(-)
MTSPRAESDLLMNVASLSRSPTAFERSSRSEPARSTSESLPTVAVCEILLAQRTQIWRIECERELCSFMSVANVARFPAPRAMTAITSSNEVHVSATRSGTNTRPFGSCRMSNRDSIAWMPPLAGSASRS